MIPVFYEFTRHSKYFQKLFWTAPICSMSEKTEYQNILTASKENEEILTPENPTIWHRDSRRGRRDSNSRGGTPPVFKTGALVQAELLPLKVDK